MRSFQTQLANHNPKFIQVQNPTKFKKFLNYIEPMASKLVENSIGLWKKKTKILYLKTFSHCPHRVNYKWFVKRRTLCLNVFHFRFSQKTSLLAGGFSWIISAVILLTPVFINRWKEFGYNENSGSFPVYCEGLRFSTIIPTSCTLCLSNAS